MWTREHFNYQLPSELIAQAPLAKRRASRLLVLNPSESSLQFENKAFPDFLRYLKPGDRLVFNNTRVIPARIHGKKSTGGKVELLLERCTSPHEALVHIRASRAPKADSILEFEDNCKVRVLEKIDRLYKVRFDREVVAYLQTFGHMPLPPYIEREDNQQDQTRYQTVFAKELGAVAAPTASLHFDNDLLNELSKSDIDVSEITLHVGAGTFQPVSCDDLSEHIMHSEYLEVSQTVVDEILETKKQGGRIIAVGTTVVRSLETAASSGKLDAYKGDSQLFITPGYDFKIIDVLLTNFHLPESTLLMLVSAFAGYENIMAAYQHAIEERYRFFSYGDAMLLFRE